MSSLSVPLWEPEMSQPVTFAASLAAVMAEAGISISDLAAISGLTVQGIHLLLRDQRQPSWATVVKLAEALSVSTDRFKP